MKHDLISLFSALDKCKRKHYRKFIRRISFSKEIRKLQESLEKPDEVTKNLIEEDTTSSEVKSEVGANSSILSSGIKGGIGTSKKYSQEYKVTESKIYWLEKELENYKNKLKDLVGATDYNEIYILLDEFYYINLIDQPLVTDYLYRLFFHTPYWIKLATNRYRTQLEERKPDGRSYGMTEGEEFTTIDLDFTLERFSSAEEFLTAILKTISEKVRAEHVMEWFAGDSFRRLVWASGGVPRDFINLLINSL